VEQPAFPGTRNSCSNIRCLRFINISFISFYGIYNASGHRRALLSNRRGTYEHAVRMGKEKHNKRCFDQEGLYSPTQPGDDSLQHNLVDTYNPSVYGCNRLHNGLHGLSRCYCYQARCQSVEEQRSQAGASRWFSVTLTLNGRPFRILLTNGSSKAVK
jgi:hypothetical protein